MKIKLMLIFITGILFLSACKPKPEIEDPAVTNIKNNLPVEFTGNFQWFQDKEIQEVSMTFSKIFPDDSGNVVSLGTGVYTTSGGSTTIQIKMTITPATNQVEIWELNPDGSADFVTDGSHIGHISKDLKTIEAVWTTIKSGEQGRLTLTANYFSR